MIKTKAVSATKLGPGGESIAATAPVAVAKPATKTEVSIPVVAPIVKKPLFEEVTESPYKSSKSADVAVLVKKSQTVSQHGQKPSSDGLQSW